VFAVLLVLAVILMQGIFAPLRPYRLFMPWAQFAGPYGIAGDRNRALILPGSTGWYAVYLALLCGLGAVVSHPGRRPPPPLQLTAGAVAILAVDPVHSFNQ
jgi:hypothetical protein